MAYRMHDSLNVVLEFLIYDPETQENIFKKVTLSKITNTLSNEQLAEVAEKLGALCKHPLSATYLVTKQVLVTS